MKKLIRYSGALLVASAIATSLTLMMTRLVAPEAIAATTEPGQSIRFHAIQPPEPVTPTRPPPPPRPPKPVEPPDAPSEPVTASTEPLNRNYTPTDSITDIVSGMARSSLSPGVPVAGPSYGSDGLLYGVAPQYPLEPLRNGIEGRVVLSVTVGPDGRVLQVEILDSKPPRTFDRSAAKAASKWKFTPSEKPLRVFQRAVVFSLDQA